MCVRVSSFPSQPLQAPCDDVDQLVRGTFKTPLVCNIRDSYVYVASVGLSTRRWLQITVGEHVAIFRWVSCGAVVLKKEIRNWEAAVALCREEFGVELDAQMKSLLLE
jgi:hypothetical protein